MHPKPCILKTVAAQVARWVRLFVRVDGFRALGLRFRVSDIVQEALISRCSEAASRYYHGQQKMQI